VKPDFFKDEDLGVFPFWVRLLYEGLWIYADREGRLENRPIKLKAEIFPYDKVNIQSGLDLLSQPKKFNPRHPPFILLYENNGDKYIQILNFHKHQTPHYTEKPSVIPPPELEDSKSTPGVLQLPKGATQVDPFPISDQGTMNLSKISFQDRQWKGVGDGDKADWAQAYPACDIDAELRKMAEWIKANPKKGKKSNYRKFIVGWLSRTQDGGGTRGVSVSLDRRTGLRPGDNIPPDDVFRQAYEKRKAQEGHHDDPQG
jgi:hypothetical protein